MFYCSLTSYCRQLNFSVLVKVVKGISKHRIFGLAAEMAYNDLLALFPAILAILTALGNLHISPEKISFLARQLREIAPEEALNLIDGFSTQLQLPQGQGLFSLSFILALWVASGSLNTAMCAVDRIYQTPSNRIRPFWQAKLIAIILTIAVVSLIFTASFLVFISDLIFTLAVSQTNVLTSEILSLWNWLRWPAALAIIAGAFGVIYRYGASQWQPGMPILLGSAIAAFLWIVSSKLFRFYVSNFANYNLSYGAAGTVVVLLLWLNLSSLAVLIGAELNAAIRDSVQATIKKRRYLHE